MVVRVKETANKCTKKCDADAKLLFCLLNLLLSKRSRFILNSLITILTVFLYEFYFVFMARLPCKAGFNHFS